MGLQVISEFCSVHYFKSLRGLRVSHCLHFDTFESCWVFLQVSMLSFRLPGCFRVAIRVWCVSMFPVRIFGLLVARSFSIFFNWMHNFFSLWFEAVCFRSRNNKIDSLCKNLFCLFFLFRCASFLMELSLALKVLLEVVIFIVSNDVQHWKTLSLFLLKSLWF